MSIKLLNNVEQLIDKNNIKLFGDFNNLFIINNTLMSDDDGPLLKSKDLEKYKNKKLYLSMEYKSRSSFVNTEDGDIIYIFE